MYTFHIALDGNDKFVAYMDRVRLPIIELVFCFSVGYMSFILWVKMSTKKNQHVYRHQTLIWTVELRKAYQFFVSTNCPELNPPIWATICSHNRPCYSGWCFSPFLLARQHVSQHICRECIMIACACCTFVNNLAETAYALRVRLCGSLMVGY